MTGISGNGTDSAILERDDNVMQISNQNDVVGQIPVGWPLVY